MLIEPAVYPNPHDKTPVRENIPTTEESEPNKENKPPETQRITEKEEGFITPFQRRFTTTTEEEGPISHEKLVRGGPHRHRRGPGQADQTAEPEGQGQEGQKMMEVPNDAQINDCAAPRFY